MFRHLNRMPIYAGLAETCADRESSGTARVHRNINVSSGVSLGAAVPGVIACDPKLFHQSAQLRGHLRQLLGRPHRFVRA
jgi:hypothetical protein